MIQKAHAEEDQLAEHPQPVGKGHKHSRTCAYIQSETNPGKSKGWKGRGEDGPHLESYHLNLRVDQRAV